MLKQIGIGWGLVLGVVVLNFGLAWLRKPSNAQLRRDAGAVFGGLTIQGRELRALGNVNIEPTNLNLAELKRQLREPTLIKDERLNTTKMGWACAGQICAILAVFQIPIGQKVPENATPSQLMMTSPIFSGLPRIGIDGVYLGEAMDEVETRFRGKTIDRAYERNRVALEDDWDLIWAGEGQISLLALSKNE